MSMVKYCGNCGRDNQLQDTDVCVRCKMDPFREWVPKDVADTNVGRIGMDTETFEQLMEEQIRRSRDVLCSKAKEYATADRLHNFRVAAALQGCTPIQALSGMMSKHTVSVYDMCESGKDYPIDLWQEKITDSINYLLLLNALVREGAQ